MAGEPGHLFISVGHLYFILGKMPVHILLSRIVFLVVEFLELLFVLDVNPLSCV